MQVGTKNFSLEEFTESSTATAKKIDNTLPAELESNAQATLVVLQKFRDALNQPINITSGYRCPKLNKAVKGVTNSAHLSATAADLQSPKLTAKELFTFM